MVGAGGDGAAGRAREARPRARRAPRAARSPRTRRHAPLRPPNVQRALVRHAAHQRTRPVESYATETDTLHFIQQRSLKIVQFKILLRFLKLKGSRRRALLLNIAGQTSRCRVGFKFFFLLAVFFTYVVSSLSRSYDTRDDPMALFCTDNSIIRNIPSVSRGPLRSNMKWTERTPRLGKKKLWITQYCLICPCGT